MLTIVTDHVKDQLKRRSPALLRWLGLSLLNKAETKALMKHTQVKVTAKSPVFLPGVTDVFDPQKVIFEPKTVQTEPDYVWDFANTSGRAELLRCGSLRVGNQFLDTDFGNKALLIDLFRPDRRPVQYFPIVLAPWSHYWGGYYDFLLFVVAKLCRLKTAIHPDIFNEAAVSYPLFNTPFETELLALLGIGPDRLIDSRVHALSFDHCILGNNSSWFYPTAADLLTLKTTIEAQLPPDTTQPRKRLYISRAGRRQVVNEAELVQMLTQYGFEVIDDKPRTVAEQVRLYQSAEFIMGPHGASFANLLWCRPGTQLLELFAPNYRPEYFRYMSQVLNLPYAAYCLGPIVESHHTNVDANMLVSVEEVEQGIMGLLGI